LQIFGFTSAATATGRENLRTTTSAIFELKLFLERLRKLLGADMYKYN
jgi:hypothetical protein